MMKTTRKTATKRKGDLFLERHRILASKKWRKTRTKTNLLSILSNDIETNVLFNNRVSLMGWMTLGCQRGGCFDESWNGKISNLKKPVMNGIPKASERNFMGILPTNLLVSLLHDTVLSQENMTFIKKHRRLIMKKPHREPAGGKCYYYMFHWGSKMTDGGRENLKEVNNKTRLLSPATMFHVQHFAFDILSKLRGQTSLSDYSFYPGVIWTERQYHQRPHVDRDEGMILHDRQSLIIHIPLCKEGMLLCCWDEKNEPHQEYTPFGCYTVLKNEQVHAGCYGSPGNVRFHIVIRHKATERVLEKDKLDIYDNLPMLTMDYLDKGMKNCAESTEKFSEFHQLVLRSRHPNLPDTYM